MNPERHYEPDNWDALLSKREREVADLVRLGMTNRDIATRLFLSERTVEGHVQQIFNKLGFKSRTQVAAWAAEQRVEDPAAPITAPAPAMPVPVPRSRRLLVAATALGVVVGGGLWTLLPGGVTPAKAPFDQVRAIGTGIVPTYGDPCIAVDSKQRVYLPTVDGVERIDIDGTLTKLTPAIEALAAAVDSQDRVYSLDHNAQPTIFRLDGDHWQPLFGRLGGTAEDAVPASLAALGYGCMTFDGDGNLYLTEARRGLVREITPDGLIHTVAGSGWIGYSGDGGPPRLARLSSPYGVASRNGQLYIADSANNRVRLVTSDRITTFAGSGRAGMAGDGGKAVDARLNSPTSIAFDTEGNLYIADSDNHRIRRVDRAGRISTAVGSGRRGSAIEGRSPEEIEMGEPNGIAIDSLDNLYIVDTLNNRVLKVRLHG